jgi:hypothetical protein
LAFFLVSLEGAEVPAPEVLGWLDCVPELIEPEALEPALAPALVLGALEPPAALWPEEDDGAELEPLALDCEDSLLEVEPAAVGLCCDFFVLDCWSMLRPFLPFFSPLCLPLFICSRPWASVVTFGLLVGPALDVSVVEPAAALLDLSVEVVLEPVFAPAFTPALAPALVSVDVLWAAASWLNDTARKPETRTGKNLRITVLLGVGKGIPKSYSQTACLLMRAPPHPARAERALQ